MFLGVEEMIGEVLLLYSLPAASYVSNRRRRRELLRDINN